jgi:dihydrofolate reductase
MSRQKHSQDIVRLPKVAIIVAMTKDRVIGDNGKLPWDLPEELLLFKRLTTGNTVIMGRKTYESIGHPLPDRHNVVLSRSKKELSGVQVCHSFLESLAAAAQQRRPVFVIGGATLYRKALPIASELHISWIHGEISGDTHFPELIFKDWAIVEQKEYEDFRYVHYQHKSNQPR